MLLEPFGYRASTRRVGPAAVHQDDGGLWLAVLASGRARRAGHPERDGQSGDDQGEPQQS
jgi:hypothetical protein